MISIIIYYIIPSILGIVIIGAIVSAVRQFQLYNKTPYYRMRQQSAQQGWLSVLMVLVALAGIIGSFYARRVVATPQEATNQAEANVTQTLPLLEENLVPTSTPAIPATITPTDEAGELPTPTATLLITSLDSSVTPPVGATINLTAISSDISAELRPVNIAEAFPVGITRVYFWFNYANMADGLSWSQVLYRDGMLVRSESDVWDQGSDGATYFFFAAQGGWPAGLYEIQFFIGEVLTASQTYEIVN